MISDSLLNLAVGVALNTGGAGSYTIGNQIDLGAAERPIGSLVGMSALFLVITFDVEPDSAGEAATANFQLITDDNSAMSSATVLAQSGAIGENSMTVGSQIVIPLPQGVAYERYIALRQVTAGEAFTAGTINAIITPTVENHFAYPQGAGASLGAS
jgi:hypothetical protein